MAENQQTVHETETYELHDRPDGPIVGWQFVCPQCGYQAHYDARAQKLEIVNLGDPAARHAGNQLPAKPALSRELMVLEKSEEDEGLDFVPLPDHLEKQLEEILARFADNW